MKRLDLLLLALVIFTLAACGGPSPSQLPTPTATLPAKQEGRGAGDTLRLLYWQAPTILNPHLTQGTKDLAACRIVYEPLASYDKDGKLIPFLAAEIPSLENGGVAADGKSVTWKLKHDVLWDDGEPFTADDVLFTYEFVSDSKTGALTSATYDAIQSVEAIDSYTVKINFKDVNPAWSLPFVGNQGMILPRHAFAGYSGENAKNAPVNQLPIGTGPYRMVAPGIKPQEVLLLGTQIVETNKIVYEINQHFREPDKPYFKKIELRGGGTVDEAARSLFEAGKVDFVYNLLLDSERLTELQQLGKAKVAVYLTSKVERLLINFTDPNRATEDGERSSLQFPHPFFSDKKVRQAFSYAMDRDSIAALYGSEGKPTANLLVSPATFESPNTSYEYNLHQAAALLDEAGWRDTNGDGVRDKDGVKMKVVFQTSVNAVRQETQNIVQKSLKSIGVEVDLKNIDASTFFGPNPANPNTRWHFYADLEMYNLGNANPDPGSYMQYWTCDEIPQKATDWAGNNNERWCNPDYDALFAKSTTEMDPEARRQLFIQMNDMIINEVVMIPLVHRAGLHGISNSLQGVDLTPWDSELWNIKDWRRVSP